MVIQHNMTAINANRQLGINTGNKTKSTERLSGGLRINRAADDAAGLTVSEKMRWSIRGLNQARRNIEDGASLIQVADGGMSEIQSILQRQRELSVQAGNDTNTAADRNAIQQEINALSVEITRIANGTTFNTHQILNHEGNLAHGPVDADSAVTTLLNQPGSSANGTLTNFHATNAAGTIQSQLLFGGNNASTSRFQVTATVGTGASAVNYTFQLGGAGCTVTNDTSIPNGVQTTFTYNASNGDPVFSLVRTVTKQDNPTGTGEVYKMDFAVENLTGENMSVELEVGMDVMFTGNDNPSFLMDGNNQETIITHSLTYSNDTTGYIPGVVNLFDVNNPYLNVQCIVDGHGATSPDYVKIGDYNSMLGSSWRENYPISDSMYSVGWKNIQINPGGTSSSFSTMYGVSDPLRNPVLAGSHSTPVEINIQAGDQAFTAITIPLVDCTADNLGVETLNVMSFGDAGVTLDKVDKAIDQVSEYRSTMGAIYNRLEKQKIM